MISVLDIGVPTVGCRVVALPLEIDVDLGRGRSQIIRTGRYDPIEWQEPFFHLAFTVY